MARALLQGRRPAARLTGTELAARNTSFARLRDAAFAWYNRNLVDSGRTVTNAHDGRMIRFERAGAKKTVRAGEDLLRLVPAIPDLLRNGAPLETEPDRGGRGESIRAWRRYAGTVDVDGQRHDVVLTVRERPDGSFHYSLQGDRKAPRAGAGSSVTMAIREDPPSLDGDPGAGRLNITPADDDVKLHKLHR